MSGPLMKKYYLGVWENVEGGWLFGSVIIFFCDASRKLGF